MSFNETLQSIVNLSTEEKIDLAAEAFANLQPVFDHFDPENHGMTFVYALLGTVIVADGKLTQDELGFAYGMLRAIGRSASEEEIVRLCEYTAKTQRQAYEIVRELRDHLNDDGATELITFVAALCAIDDRIDSNEVNLIKSLF